MHASDLNLLSPADLERVFTAKYGGLARTGWSPRRRLRHGYYLPSDIYEATVDRLIFRGCRWIDVGGGHDIFPHNRALAGALVERCTLVVGVDPSDNIRRNEFVHRWAQCLIEDYVTRQKFDVATLRMVAEHIAEPKRVVEALGRLLCPGGYAVVLTVNRWSPLAIVSKWTPFRMHHPLKKMIWGGQAEDTFPVHYKMNTRGTLRMLFEDGGFREAAFAHLDDLSTFGRFSLANHMELAVWRGLRKAGLHYPENCLLGVYQRT